MDTTAYPTMSFGTAIRTVFRNYAEFDGRAGRPEFLAVAVRRLRDSGRRWTELFWLLAPIAGPGVLIVRLCEPTKSEVE